MLIAIFLAAVLLACGSGDLVGDVGDESRDRSRSESGASAEPEATAEDRFASVSAGAGHTCVVRTDGFVECWGNDEFGQATPPAGGFASVSAGGWYTCGVRADGFVECWGDDEYGQATPPAGEFASVSAGDYHTCGVRTDGFVECWGNDGDGQATPPAGKFVSVSAGADHTCGVRTDGSVECWGDDQFGQVTQPVGEFAAVSAGDWYTCGVKIDGSVECWGDGDGEAMPPAGGFASVSTGSSHTCGVRTDGSVECWGDDYSGKATPLAGEFVSVSAGGDHTCGVRPDGYLECWGYEEKAASSESAPTVDNSSQTPEVAEQTNDTQPETSAVSKQEFCLVHLDLYLENVDKSLFRLVSYVNAGLDDPWNVSEMRKQAGIDIPISDSLLRGASDGLGFGAVAPEDAKKLGRSIDEFNEKLMEFDADLEELNERKVTRRLQDLIDDFLDVQGKAEDYCGS